MNMEHVQHIIELLSSISWGWESRSAPAGFTLILRWINPIPAFHREPFPPRSKGIPAPALEEHPPLPHTQECPETSYLMGSGSAALEHGEMTHFGPGLRDISCPWRPWKSLETLRPLVPASGRVQKESEGPDNLRETHPLAEGAPVRDLIRDFFIYSQSEWWSNRQHIYCCDVQIFSRYTQTQHEPNKQLNMVSF